MCFSPSLILLLPLSVLLILCAYKTPLFGVPAFLPFKTTPLLLTQVSLAANPNWLFRFLFTCLHKPRSYLLCSTDPIWPPVTCSRYTCSASRSLSFGF